MRSGTAAIDASAILSRMSCDEVEIHWAKEFDDDFQLADGSEAAVISKSSRHMGSEEAARILYDEPEIAWATGLDIPLIDGFEVPLFAGEEWPFALEEFTSLEEQL